MQTAFEGRLLSQMRFFYFCVFLVSAKEFALILRLTDTFNANMQFNNESADTLTVSCQIRSYSFVIIIV